LAHSLSSPAFNSVPTAEPVDTARPSLPAEKPGARPSKLAGRVFKHPSESDVMMDMPPQTMIVAKSPRESKVGASVQGDAARPASSSDAYLPLNGPLPLRFTAQKRWPAPLPVAEPDAENAAVQAVVEPVPPVLAAATSTDAAPDGSHERNTVGRSMNEPSPNQPHLAATTGHISSESPMLTAELVLGYINDLSGGFAIHNERFLPALPERSGNTLAAASSTR